MSIQERSQELNNSILEGFQEKFNSVIELCESEIEKLFLLNITNAINQSPISSISFCLSKQDEIVGLSFTEDSDVQIEIYPQKTMIIRDLSFRMDFFIKFRLQGKTKYLCIECDGFEFHGRTIEQVDRDNLRDRTLSSKGIRVIRLSGSEIYRESGNDDFFMSLIIK